MNITPVHIADGIFVKRDDLYMVAGVCGGKARTCWALAQGAAGLVTAGSRSSPQINIVAHIAKHLGIPARAHAPQGALSPELLSAQAAGCQIIQHRAGYNNVIIARARADAAGLPSGWREIPFGMECEEAITQTRRQVINLPYGVRRVVVPVGSGMTLAGVLWGMHDHGLQNTPVLGVSVGAAPTKRLLRYAPFGWQATTKIIEAGSDYHLAVAAKIDGAMLDPHYEAKCVKFLENGDLLWVVGCRETSVSA